MDPNAATWLDTALAWLQANAGWLQAIAAFAAIPATLFAAGWGARLAYKLSEKSARDRELRAAAEEAAALRKHADSMRLLLSLEVRRNLDDLNWLQQNLLDVLGPEDELHWAAVSDDVERLAWFEARQRFISLYMPEWSHSFWHGQQSSHLLPEALGPEEIRQLNFFHSQLDRLTRLKEMLAERAQHRTDGAASGRGGFREEAPVIWKDFTETMRDLIDSPPSLAGQTIAPAKGRALALDAAHR